uniref:NADH-ubiquinone oxidoreductase chain 3 n=1 Tax=Armadillidium vulgare TaxID=13347 RepID=B0F0Z9_ARMVU|nr:NADH dehydrogenase subunit 3 [Armadillidium vulgare]
MVFLFGKGSIYCINYWSNTSYLTPSWGVNKLENMSKLSHLNVGLILLGIGHLNFSVRFFLIAVIFMIFDVEIALLLPLMVIFSSSNMMIWGVLNLIFLLVLSFGVFYEWWEGALDWKI